MSIYIVSGRFRGVHLLENIDKTSTESMVNHSAYFL